MIKMTDKSKAFLKENLPEVMGAINRDNPRDILGPLYDLIMYRGFINHAEGYNDFGYEAQDVYDDIFYSNYDD